MPQKRALIVEDSSNWAKQHRLALEELGFEAALADEFPQALGLLLREKFDLVVIDLHLKSHAEPENLNGVFLLDFLVNRSTPVIIVTAWAYRELVEHIYQEYGIFEILDKLLFNAEKFKQNVLLATAANAIPTSISPEAKTRARARLENLVLQLLQRDRMAPLREVTALHPDGPSDGNSRIFISHSHADVRLASRLAEDLRAAGFDLWYDIDQIEVGDTILEKIDRGLSECEYMIIVLSPEAMASKMVRQELIIFLNEELKREQKVVLPVLYRDCEMPHLLEGRRYADFRGDYENGWEELARSLGLRRARSQGFKASEVGC